MRRVVIFSLVLFGCLSLASCLKDSLSKNGNSGGTNSVNNSGTTGTSGTTNGVTTVSVTLSDLLGKWQLINDSTTTNFWGLWDGRAPHKVNYLGTPADYYNFTPYGKLYIHENTVIDTQTYILSHDTVLYRYAYIDGQTNKVDSAYDPLYVITKFTGSNCTLTSFFITPETASFSTINLRK